MAKHPHRVLTSLQINKLTKPGRYADGNGLYLVVDPSGSKRWVLRTMAAGRRRDIGLGGLRLVSLAEARERAVEYRGQARSGLNPIEERRKARRSTVTFREAARTVFESHKGAWKNSKHQAQWLSSLEAYAFPLIGDRSIDDVGVSDVLRVLTPIWLKKQETSRRVRQRIKATLDWAKAAGHRTGDNPADEVTKALPKQSATGSHFAAIPYSEVPAFVKQLKSFDAAEPAKLAFELLLLTAARTNEILNATWAEFDVKAAVWTVPASRMKAGKEHRVPLSPRALQILKRAKLLSGESFVFPGRTEGRPMSNMVFLMILRRMEVDFTAHGFRSAFRDWAAETTNFPREVCEMALAHTIKSKAEAAYRRGDMLDKRRALMSEWAEFATHG